MSERSERTGIHICARTAPVAVLAEDGDLLGMSVGFLPIKSEWQILAATEWAPDLGPDHMDRVMRRESRLVEVSLTPTPAFADAEVTCVRTRYSLELRAQHLGPAIRPQVDAWRELVDGLRCP